MNKFIPGKLGTFVLVLLIVAQTQVFAHAFLDHADPKVGSEISKAPAEVKLWFTEDIEPAFSTVKVFDATGKQVDRKDTHVDKKDGKLLIVSISPVPAGDYRVAWSVVSKDTHRTEGDFKFKIKP